MNKLITAFAMSCFFVCAAFADNGQVEKLQSEIQQLNKQISELKKTIELQRAEITRLKTLCKENGINTNIQHQAITKQVAPVAYEIVESEDQSHKAMTKALSSYTYQELESLPTDKKMGYRVVVSPEIKENQVKPTIDKIITDITSKDNDIDEISLLLYSDKELANGMYDVARATWAPGGELGNVTPEIAQSNIRSDYKTTIQVADNLEQYLKQRAKPEDRFGLTEVKRRKIFKEIVSTEDKAQAEADKKYPISGQSTWGLSKSELRSQIDKNINLMRDLEKQYKKELSKKYSLTQEQLKQISIEGISERWPLE